ncbi:hypothetical protein [Variovorax boronicumulans]|uniref:hypothetical protein n=1 Tax=Variovorax boronicumulans TaxID=436515 RepID=UPI0012E689A9|nr:hypothetical protein [Variovorax boronicumulans]GER16716.1 hypothetical protein VCH24_17230 [Variovorax boronicumulans]
MSAAKRAPRVSLVDPTNPARWADGSPRSLNNAFVLGYSDTPRNFVAELQRESQARATSTRSRAKRVAAGTDRSHIHGLSKKASQPDPRATEILKPRAGGITLTNSATNRADNEKCDRTRRGGR